MKDEAARVEGIREAVHDVMNGEGDGVGSEAEELSSEARRTLADEQLLHALLQHHYGESADSATRRVERVMSAISPRRSRRRRVGVLSAVFSSAAAILLAVVLLQWSVAPPVEASSAFERAVAAFLAQGDRTYVIDVSMEETSVESGSLRRWMRPVGPVGREGKGVKRLLDGARLYLRGGDRYVFEMEVAGRKRWTGRDGDRVWLVRPRGPVLTSDDPDAFLLPFSDDMTSIALMDVQDTLQAAREGYRVEPAESVRLSDDGPVLKHFVAYRRSARVRRPAKIELWVDPVSGLLRRLTFTGMRTPGGYRVHLTMAYENSDALPANWFHYEGHVRSGTAVRNVTREEVKGMRRGPGRRGGASRSLDTPRGPVENGPMPGRRVPER